MDDHQLVATGIIEGNKSYLVLAPPVDGNNEWQYVWRVKDEDQRKEFQEILKEFLGDNDG